MQTINDLYHILKVVLNFIRMGSYETIIFWIVGFILIFLGGMCIVRLCGMDEKIELYYMAGCIFAVSVCHITASIMESFGMTFSTFKTVTLCVYGMAIVAMVIACIKKEHWLTKGLLKKHFVGPITRFKGYSSFDRVLFIVIAGFCCYIMLNSMCRLYQGGDDGYYVVKIGMIIHDDSLRITNEQATNGMVHVPSFIRADASTWSTFLALLASTFDIDYAVIAHVAIVPFVLMAAVAIILLIAKAMFDSTISISLFWISFIMLALTVPDKNTMTLDYWIFSSPWYGQTVLYLMIYFLIYCLLMLSKREEYFYKTGFWLFVTLAVTAVMATEIVAVYLIPCFVLMFGIPYIVVNRHRISASAIFKICWILLPILHSGISVLTAYRNMTDHALNGGENGGFDMALSSVAAWDTNQAEIYWGITSQNIYTILTIVCLLLIKDKKIQRFFGWSFLVAIVTFLNPLFYKFVCVHVSTEIVYYRLYWCIPNLLIIAYCFVEHLMGMLQNKNRMILTYMVFAVYIVGFRQNVYGDNQSTWTTNIKKIPYGAAMAAESLLSLRGENDKIYALVPWSYCDYIRQYSLDIVYPLGRRSPNGDFKIPGSNLSYFELYTKVYSINEELGELSDEDVSVLISLGTQIIMFWDESEIPEVLQKYDAVTDEYGYHYIML